MIRILGPNSRSGNSFLIFFNFLATLNAPFIIESHSESWNNSLLIIKQIIKIVKTFRFFDTKPIF